MNGTKGYGADVVIYNRYQDDREEIVRKFEEETGAPIIRPYDNFYCIAGQGTCALEIFEDMPKPELDFLFACVGGGTLVCGSAITARHFSPNCKVIGVVPTAVSHV